MRMADVVECDVGAALVEHRRGWLVDLNLSDAFLYYAGDNHREEVCFKDGSRLMRDRDSLIYRVVAPDGRVLIEG